MAAIRAEVDALARVSSRELDGVGALELFDGVFELSDRMQAIAVRVLPVVEAGVPWPMRGARTFPGWLAARAHLTQARAQQVTRLARALRDELPLTAAAVVQGGQGRVSVEQAEIRTTTAATSAIRRAALIDPEPAGERFLLEQAALVAGGPATNARQPVGRSSGPRGRRARIQGRHRPGVLRRVTHHRRLSPVPVPDHRTQPKTPRRPASRARRPRG
ncbi:MAG: DUF222 domain-containing protein [Cellulomonas sp.]|nr:DUF222 domain-containing protein [Cellulomonas sp.]